MEPDSNGHGELRALPALPRYGTRGSGPGPRGCWAVKADGQACGAARRSDGDYCNAHSGRGIAEDPAKYQPLATAASAANRHRRAVLRATLGITRPDSTRGMLRAMVHVEAERVAAAALSGALDPDIPAAQRAKHALVLLDAVEPQQSVGVEVALPTSPDQVAQLGLSDLEALAAQLDDSGQ